MWHRKARSLCWAAHTQNAWRPRRRILPIKCGATPCGHSIELTTATEGHEYEIGESLDS